MDVLTDSESLKIQLNGFRREHRELDLRITELTADVHADQLTVRRLKKRKLHLKDQIGRLEDLLYPDIIA